MVSTRHLVLKAITGKLKPKFVGPFQVEAKWEPTPLDLPCQTQCEFTQYLMSHFYNLIKESINLQDQLK